MTTYTQLEVRHDQLELRSSDDMEVLVTITRHAVKLVKRDFRKDPCIEIQLGGVPLVVSYADRNDGGEQCANDYDDIQMWLGGVQRT